MVEIKSAWLDLIAVHTPNGLLSFYHLTLARAGKQVVALDGVFVAPRPFTLGGALFLWVRVRHQTKVPYSNPKVNSYESRTIGARAKIAGVTRVAGLVVVSAEPAVEARKIGELAAAEKR